MSESKKGSSLMKCKECNLSTGYLERCHFCDEPLCEAHMHFLVIPERSVYGYFNKTVVVCKECKPKMD